jgi:SAM-dependent methyltransferase
MGDGARNRAIVEAGYDNVADRYPELEAGGREWPRMRWLAKLLGQIEPGAAVLDVGCGNGVPATRAISERFAATGIDISAAQVERARENVPGARFLHGDLLAADFGQEFDAITAFYVVDHVERERHASIFELFDRWLRPSGWLLLSIEPRPSPAAFATGWADRCSSASTTRRRRSSWSARPASRSSSTRWSLSSRANARFPFCGCWRGRLASPEPHRAVALLDPAADKRGRRLWMPCIICSTLPGRRWG